MPGNLNAAQPRPIPSFESMRIGDKPLPTSFALALRQSWTQMYDLRDYLLNLFVDDEVPNGPMNGSNKTFTLANSPLPPQSLELYRNGQFLVQGTDYNLIGKTLTLAVAPVSTDTLIAFYRERLAVPNQPASQPIPPVPPTGGGGGSTGGLWTQNANFLYPTATFTECVLVGAQTSDFFGAAGQLGTTGTIGMMTAAANASLVYLFINPGIETQLVSNKSGTGTLLPLSFYAGGFKAVVQTTGDFIVGARTTDAATGPNVYSVGGFFGILSASTNSHALLLSVNGATETVIHSSFTGTGAALPLSLYLSGVRYFTLQTSGALLGGLFTSDISPTAGMIVLTSAYFLVTTATNASTFQIHAGSGIFEFISSSTGTGSIVPVRFSMGGTEVARYTTTGAYLVGLTSSDFSAAGRGIATDSWSVVTATTNASCVRIGLTAGTETYLISFITGTGTQLPLSFYTNTVRRVTIDTSGTFILGALSTSIPTNARILTLADVICASAATGAISYLQMTVNAGTSVNVASGATGGGTQLPLWLVLGGIFAAGIDTNRALLVGITTSDLSNGGGEIIAVTEIALVTAATNASVIRFIQTAGTANFIQSTVTGTGTSLPIAFSFGGTETDRITTAGVFLGGITSQDGFTALGDIISVAHVGVVTAATNASTMHLAITAGTESRVVASITGTGTNLPMSFYTNSARRWTINTNGALLGGSLNDGSYGTITGRIITLGDFIITTGFTANESFARLQLGGNVVNLESNRIGTGTFLPLTFNTGGVEVARFRTAGSLLLGLSSSDIGDALGWMVISGVFNIASAATNAHVLSFSINGATETLVNSSFSGTGTTLPFSIYVGGVRVVQFSTPGVMKHTPTTVAGLPAGADGMRAFVTDATTLNFGTVVVGGGANHVPVYFSSGAGAWAIG